jgi:hypothetical protein
MRRINNSLRRNRRILKEFYEKQLLQVQRHELLEKGFRFGYCTHVKKDSDKSIHYCYDVAYYEDRGRIYLRAENA